jgi:hypothetical protein
MRFHRQMTIALASVLMTSSLGLTSSAHASSAKSKPLSVCLDANRQTKTGALDVLLLLDNSKSLNSTKNGRRPSDGKNERYKAIAEMLKSLGEVSSGGDEKKGVEINFGVVAFGRNANSAIDIGPLSAGNASEVGEQVEAKVPGKVGSQSNSTNYIDALKAALETLNERPEENCKFLVWFTDGQFDLNEPKELSDQREEAEMLKRSVCGPGGFAKKFKDSRINTFVLILKPTDTDQRLAVSYGAMQAITGDTDLPPEVQNEIGKSSDMCGNLGSAPHLGDVLIASDAKEIARKIPTIANSLTSWEAVTDCPANPKDEDFPGMPAARHIARLSFTAYEKGRELGELGTSEVIDNSGKPHPFSDYFIEDSGSQFEQKYRFNESAEKELNQGWSIEVKNGFDGWCVQMLAHKFEVAFKGSPAISVLISSGGFLNAEDMDNLVYFEKSKEEAGLSLAEALTFTGEVAASLVIDPQEKIYSDAIPVSVKQQNSPNLSCESFILKDVGDIPSPSRYSTFCDIDTAQTVLKDVSIRVIPDPVLNTDKCNAILGLTERGIGGPLEKGYAFTPDLIHPQGTSRLYLTFEAKGQSTKCESKNSVVEFRYANKNGKPSVIERAVEINVDWKPRPNSWLVWTAVLLALMMVALMNLMLLREIKKRTSRMTSSGVLAFEVPIRLSRMRSGQLTVKTSDGSELSSVVFNIAEQVAVKVEADRRRAKLTDGSRSALRVKLPSLFKPFTAPLLVLESKKSVYYSPNFEGRSGLSPLARQAVILHSPTSDGESCEAMATLLIPNIVAGKEQMIRDLLGSKLTNAIKPAANDSDWFTSSVSQPGESGSTASAPIAPSGSSSVSSVDVGGLRPPRPGHNR